MSEPQPKPTHHIPGRLPVWERLDELFNTAEYSENLSKVLDLTTGTTLGVLSLQAEQCQLHCYRFASEPGIFGINIQQTGLQRPLLSAAFVTWLSVEIPKDVFLPAPAHYLHDLIGQSWVDPALTEEHASALGASQIGMVVRPLQMPPPH
jgi:hypothetical protein